MKKLLFIAAIMAAAAISCTKEQRTDEAAKPADSFFATLPQTRTYIDGVSTRWSGDERISVLNGSSNYAYGTSDSGASATFTYAGFTDGAPLAANPSGVVSTETWALYPYNAAASLRGSTIREAWISDEQALAPGAFSSQRPLLVARSDAEGRLAFKIFAAE